MWENNVKFIEQHNIEAANGLHTFNVGENEFADWTTVEFVKYFNGLNMSLSQRDFMENDKNNQMIRDLPDQVDWRDKVEYNSIECTVSSIYRLHRVWIKKNYTPILLHSVFNTYDYAFKHTYA